MNNIETTKLNKMVSAMLSNPQEIEYSYLHTLNNSGEITLILGALKDSDQLLFYYYPNEKRLDPVVDYEDLSVQSLDTGDNYEEIQSSYKIDISQLKDTPQPGEDISQKQSFILLHQKLLEKFNTQTENYISQKVRSGDFSVSLGDHGIQFEIQYDSKEFYCTELSGIKNLKVYIDNQNINQPVINGTVYNKSISITPNNSIQSITFNTTICNEIKSYNSFLKINHAYENNQQLSLSEDGKNLMIENEDGKIEICIAATTTDFDKSEFTILSKTTNNNSLFSNENQSYETTNVTSQKLNQEIRKLFKEVTTQLQHNTTNNQNITL